MYIAIVNIGENFSSKVENPTPETVNELTTALNGGDVAFFQIYGEKGYLTIASGEYGRVWVSYSDRGAIPQPHSDRHWGHVVDSSLMNDKREIRVDWGTETTPNPIYWTVPSAKALEIALYFLEHEAPPKGLAWDGRMDRFQ